MVTFSSNNTLQKNPPGGPSKKDKKKAKKAAKKAEIKARKIAFK